MNNKEKEAQILACLGTPKGIDGVAETMTNRVLAEEYIRRDEEYRKFVLNPGPNFEPKDYSNHPPNPNPGQIGQAGPYPAWTFPDPRGDDALYAPALATQGYGEAFSKSTPYVKMEQNFNWLMTTYGQSAAYNYLANNPMVITTLSNQFRKAFDNGGPASAKILNDYQWGGGAGGTLAAPMSQTSEDGAIFYYGPYPVNLTFYLPHPTGTAKVPTPPI